MSIVQKIKSVFRPKAPTYKTYTPSQLRVMAMRARISLQQHYKKSLQIIQESDSILLQRKQYPGDCYRILQEIGKHVIELESIKIYVEMLRKIEDRSAAIVKTGGDIALMKTQLNWFQCLLWYRKCRKVAVLDNLHQFCYNFFKGVDITCQLHPKCEIFRIFPITLYLDPNCIIPLKKIFPQIMTYLTTKLDYNFMEEIFKLNRDEIRKWVNRDRVEYQQRYLSKSKSPIKIQKSKTPTKVMKKQEKRQQEIDLSKSSKQDYKPNNNNDIGNSVSMQNSMSFMRKIMQSSKLKKNKLCAQCGTQIINTMSEGDMGLGGQGGSFAALCQQCTNKDKNQENMKDKQPEIESQQHRQLENQEKDRGMCTVCHKEILIHSNDISFSNKEQGKIQQQHNDICPECWLNQHSEPHEDLTKQHNPQQQQHEHEQQHQKQHKQQSPKVQLQVAHEQQQYDDQAQSIAFIRQSVVVKKKPLKKPYMVSIYGRAEYINQSSKK